MSFAERLLRRRQGLGNIVGFNGGTLEDQLNPYDEADQSPDRMSGVASQTGQILTPTNQANITRPRTVTQADQTQANPFADRLMRQRRTQPRDLVSDDAQYLSDIQNKPLSTRDKFGLAAQVISRNLGSEPLPTRRQRDVQRAQGQLQTDLGVADQQYKQRALQSQMDAREANILAAQERIRQGDERLSGQADALKHRETQDYHNNLIRVYNAQTDFDPDNPDNADFVAEWQRAFGYKPKRNIRGSQMAVIQGYRPDGSPIVSVVNKGTNTATEVQGAIPTTTEGQQNRTAAMERSRYVQGQTNQRAMQSQAGANQRAGMRQGTVSTDRPTARRAAALVGKIESARQAISAADERLKRDPNNKQARADREAARQAGESWAAELNNLNAGYEAGPGTQGYPYYKKAEQQTQGDSGKPAKSLSAIRQAAQSKGLDPDEAERRARARTDITLIP